MCILARSRPRDDFKCSSAHPPHQPRMDHADQHRCRRREQERDQPNGNIGCCAQSSRLRYGWRALAVVSGGTTNGTTCSLASKLARYCVAACWVENGPIRTRYQVPRPGTRASRT